MKASEANELAMKFIDSCKDEIENILNKIFRQIRWESEKGKFSTTFDFCLNKVDKNIYENDIILNRINKILTAKGYSVFFESKDSELFGKPIDKNIRIEWIRC